MTLYKRVDILGCPFDAISFEETMALIRDTVTSGQRRQFVPGSIDFVMKARRDPVFAEELWKADIVFADGMPIVWAASLLGTPIRGRVPGTDVVWECAQVSQQTGCGIAMIGGDFSLTKGAAEKMREAFPKAALHPLPTPFPLGEKENEELVRQIRALQPGIVLVALGAPRQERWVKRNLEACGANVGIGIGSAFDIISGSKPRAPRWMQDNGLEWFHRMMLEPRRLGKRYLIDDSPFLFYLTLEIVRRTFHRNGRKP